MTRAFELQLWLRANGPATMAQIEDAGFLCLRGKTRRRMIESDAITTYMAPTSDSGGRYKRIVAMHYEATDIDYTPHRGRVKGAKVAPPDPIQRAMDRVAIRYAHKMALDLECILAEYGGSWYDTAMQTLSEYRSAMNAIHESVAPTHMGEPVLGDRA